MNGKYHFIKLRPNFSENRIREIKEKGTDKDKEILNGTWYLVADSIEVIKEHWRKYCASYIKEGIRQIVNKFSKQMENVPAGHYTNSFANVVEITSEIKRIPLWQAATELENEALNSRITTFNKGNFNQCLSHDMTILIYNDTVSTVIEEKYSDILTFPDEEKPSIDDVRFIQWNGGEHWYAKIGKLDVVDVDNNQKWNTKEEAEKAAKWWIEKNY